MYHCVIHMYVICSIVFWLNQWIAVVFIDTLCRAQISYGTQTVMTDCLHMGLQFMGV